jgi:hypothetical protein
MNPGDAVTFEHPAGSHTVKGKLVAIGDGFYVVDDGVTRPMHRIAVKYATVLDFRAISDETSHAE